MYSATFGMSRRVRHPCLFLFSRKPLIIQDVTKAWSIFFLIMVVPLKLRIITDGLPCIWYRYIDLMSPSNAQVSAQDQIDLAKLLLKKGADVNATSTFNQTPLLMAANNGFMRMVNLLLEHEGA